MILWYISFSISVLFLALAVAVWFIKPKKKKRLNVNTLILLTGAFIFGAGIFMFLPIYTEFFLDTGTLIPQIFKTFILSIHNTIRLFVVDSDFEMIKEVSLGLSPFLKDAYPILATILFIVSPILTFGFLMTFFKEMVASFLCWLSRNKDAYVFTELNDYSVTLATDIRKNHPKALIIFTDVYKSATDETITELHERAQEISAICFKKDITLIKLLENSFTRRALLKSRAKKINFIRKKDAGFVKSIENKKAKLDNAVKENSAISIEEKKNNPYRKALIISRAKRIRFLRETRVNKKIKKLRKICFFILNEKEDENSKGFLHLNNTFKYRENTEIYIFSKNVLSDLLVSSFRNSKIKVRRIDYAQSLISRTLYDSGYELLFEKALPDKTDDNYKVISAVIVGLGQYGKAMAKALTWYCQMDGYKIKINAFDEDPNAESIFASETQELLDPLHNGVYIEGEAQYSITIHSGISYKTKEFDEKIMAIDDATFVFVSLGDDATNIECSLKLRTFFERMGVKPSINTIVYDADQKEALRGASNHKNQSYDFNFIGGIDTTYSEKVVLDTELEVEGRDLNRGYWGCGEHPENIPKADKSFWKYDYNYRSSIASALHQRAKLRCNFISPNVRYEDATPEERAIIEKIEKMEHRRWCAYMRTEGYVWGKTKHDLAKVHHDLVVYDKLSVVEKRKDSAVLSKK